METDKAVMEQIIKTIIQVKRSFFSVNLEGSFDIIFANFLLLCTTLTILFLDLDNIYNREMLTYTRIILFVSHRLMRISGVGMKILTLWCLGILDYCEHCAKLCVCC